MRQIVIAVVAHGINRAYCASLGDDSIPVWDETTEQHRKSILAGVQMHLDNPEATPEQSHESWLAQKVKEGWQYGEVKDVDKKLHPNIASYAELPQEQKSKDYLFKAVVHAIKGASEAMAEEMETDIRAQLVETAPVASVEVVIGQTPVRYIGRPDEWVERRYKSGLRFSKGQIRNLPNDLARKMLRHEDLFVIAEVDQGAEDDDTAEQLGKAKGKGDEAHKVEEETQAMREQVQNMNKESLEHFAFTRYQQSINKRRSVENLREEVIGLVDQYGVV